MVVADEPRAGVLAHGLVQEGFDVVAVVSATTLADTAADALLGAEAEGVRRALDQARFVVLQATRATLNAPVVALCDRLGTRIAPLCATADDERLAEVFGLAAALPLDVDAWALAQSLTSASAIAAPIRAPARGPGIIAVWGPAGSPGRSTIAVELAAEIARGGRHVGLVDADSHAPSLALALGLADEAPGFAAACRQTELGGLDVAELTRISAPVTLGGGTIDVLTGINRPSRWPELSEIRVTRALEACRSWADHTIVDVSASLERDEEIVSDLTDGPRRNAATIAALRSADLVVAVVSADPLGVARFVRGYADLRETVGTTPVTVVANRLRPGSLGIDARGQVRRALDRFAGIRDVWFVPADPRSADAALLAARPIVEVAPRSPLTSAVRRVVGESVLPHSQPIPAKPSRRGRRESLRITGEPAPAA
ncbi:MAG: P-loop NTPase [Actinobacteria bacterium]|nr:P-loop NTPase [Actinomycetota bacterium]